MDNSPTSRKRKHSLTEVVKVRDEGFTILAEPDEAILDVVFVHGLTGHPERTWTYTGPTQEGTIERDGGGLLSKLTKIWRPPSSTTEIQEETCANSVFWPRDLLGDNLPKARILTYGYDSNVRHRLSTQVNQNTILDLGQNLVSDLEAKRRAHPKRPIIFVAHSLGGILVKEALRRSEGHRVYQQEFYNIYDSTFALIFFGTPHRGADPRSLIRTVAENVLRAAQFVPNDKLLDGLLPSSERLKELREEFSKMLRAKEWKVYSFQEGRGVLALGGDKVVQDWSSTLDDPTFEITKPLSGDHREMCRFKNADDIDYERVVAAFERLTNLEVPKSSNSGILSLKEKEDLLQSLAFKQMDARHSNIRRAYARTCKWLFQTSQYKCWLERQEVERHHGLLWIKGKPGSGKSTIMKEAVGRVCKKSPNLANRIVIKFFFNARGIDPLEKSSLGMYRSLCHQLLMALPSLQEHFAEHFQRKARWANDNDNVLWSIAELQNFISDSIETLGQHSLFIFIDALDECEEMDVRAMVRYLEELGQVAIVSGRMLNICLSSRHYPRVSVKSALSLTLEDQSGHAQDIANYIANKLIGCSDAQSQGFRDEICRKAAGVFLWVALVVEILNEAEDRGEISTMKKRLEEIPDDLDALFAEILSRHPKDREKAVLLFQWILFAQRPLEPIELHCAVESIDIQLDPQELPTVDNIKKFILHYSKGLTEISKSEPQRVQFIHETVRTFFLQNGGLASIQKVSKEDVAGISHDKLKSCCFNYMLSLKYMLAIRSPDTEPPDLATSPLFSPLFSRYRRDWFTATRVEIPDAELQTVLPKYPFSEYATTNLFQHADLAERNGVPQIQFLHSLASRPSPHSPSMWLLWMAMNNSYEKYPIRQYAYHTSMLYVFSERNFFGLVKALISTSVDVNKRGGRYGYALQAACFHGNEEIVRSLIDAGADVNARGGEHGYALVTAAHKKHIKILRLLEEKGAIWHRGQRDVEQALKKLGHSPAMC